MRKRILIALTIATILVATLFAIKHYADPLKDFRQYQTSAGFSGLYDLGSKQSHVAEITIDRISFFDLSVALTKKGFAKDSTYHGLRSPMGYWIARDSDVWFVAKANDRSFLIRPSYPGGPLTLISYTDANYAEKAMLRFHLLRAKPIPKDRHGQPELPTPP